jgi:lysozyme family protein
MERNFKRALSAVLKHEGGFVDHPKDPGGATNKGITIATFRRFVNPGGTVADLKAITHAQVDTVYRRQYWDAIRGNELPDGVDFAVFDFAVNSGPGRAIKYLQAVVGVTQDGVIGPATIQAVKAKLPATVIHDICNARLAFLKRLKTWETFKRGWERRVREVKSLALIMSAPGDLPSVPPVPIPKQVQDVLDDADKPMGESSTITAQFMQWLFGGGATSIIGTVGDKLPTWAFTAIILVGVTAAGWFGWQIISERKRKTAMAKMAKAAL